MTQWDSNKHMVASMVQHICYSVHIWGARYAHVYVTITMDILVCMAGNIISLLSHSSTVILSTSIHRFWKQGFLGQEGEVIDYESKDVELVKDEMVIQTMAKKIMTEVNENQPNVIDSMVEGQIDLELFAAP